MMNLDSEWSSGTGPRIACVRNYPMELQFRALEQIRRLDKPESETSAEEPEDSCINESRKNSKSVLPFNNPVLDFKQPDSGFSNLNSGHLASPGSAVFFSPRPRNELNAAALAIQRIYRGYRARRNLADSAVVVEELWWKALDSAGLDRSSVSFSNLEKPETAISRWVRLRGRTRAAKVGKGLSEDEKAVQHWLEAIDPRHRYGHNLQLYYDLWFKTESAQPFFYWLDIGEGKYHDHEKCPKFKLQQQCIKYLGPVERESYEVIFRNGKLVYKQSGLLLDTTESCKWIFVLGTRNNLYVGQKQKGMFTHSSFLAGGLTMAAGRLVAHDGVLEAIWPYRGNYLPTEENYMKFIGFLVENHVDISNVKIRMPFGALLICTSMLLIQ